LSEKNHHSTKIAFGLVISALSVLVMVLLFLIGGNGAEKVSVWWLVADYGIITIGELLSQWVCQ
jgi:POT family proton-dependent oligopeptide transporter